MRCFCTLCCAGLLAGSTLAAEMHIEVGPGGSAWISPAPSMVSTDAEALFETPPYWIVQCAPLGCFARTGPLILVIDEAGHPILHFDPHPTGKAILQIVDYAYDLEDVIGTSLNEVWVARLSAPAAHLVTETEYAEQTDRPLMGFDLALHHLRGLAGIKPAEETHLTALGDAADVAHEEAPKLIPDTKPQIQFAIRAQLGAPES